ncbi:hypothetical protein U6A24_13680 [Aquimarina gracilis]|uniref:Uncharacterized protein n=1 Tax=Aquimarina gracilis TaxID=874422 RepID=A0ABU5ZXA8_9FLAO|nr:hypothetical protein [Aquimarina gracilis]MEB3346523.1 hypothetical protein [Aquimarina gracilis]
MDKESIMGSASYDAAINSLRNMTATYDKIITKIGDVEVTHERVFKAIESSTEAVVSATETVTNTVEVASDKAEKAVDKAESKYDKFAKKLGGGKVAKSLASVFKSVDNTIEGMDMGSKGIEKLKGGLEGLQKIVPINENTIGLYNGLSDAIGMASVAQGILNSVMAVAEVVQWAFNAAAAANPVGLVIAGVIALAGAVIYAWNNFEEFRGTIVGVWDVLKSFGSVILDFVITRIKELISGFSGLGTAVMKFFEGDWDGAVAAGKQALSDFTGAESGVKLAVGIEKAWDKMDETYDAGYKVGADESSKLTLDVFQGMEVTKLFQTEDGTIMKRKHDVGPQIAFEKKGDLSPKGGGVGGGRQISVGSLIDTLNINVTHLKQSSAEIREILKKLLLEELQNVERAQETRYT